MTQMHLFAMPMGSGAHIAGWRHPLAGESRLHDAAHYVEIGRLAEQGCFDAVFLADAQGFRPVPGQDAFACLDGIRMDPVTVLAAMAMATTRVGLVATLSTSYNEPYSAARRLATLDHLSGGRAGWNVVTSTTEHEAHNFGRDAHYGHAERYARAGEFVDVVRGLWDGWADDAVIADRAGGRYCDPARIGALGHRGEIFTVEGPLTMGRPPQGHPVIVQAGASDGGLDLAARVADVVFTSHPARESAQRFTADLKARGRAAGRNDGGPVVLTAIQPIVAATRAEAQAISAELDALISPGLALATLSAQFGGVDLSGYDPEGPLPDLPDSGASVGSRRRIVELAARENLSLLGVARKVAAGRTSHTLAGTAEDIADELGAWFAAGAADGFVIAAPVLPALLERFVTGVAPILQSRGLLRDRYHGTTLRDHLGIARPPRQVPPCIPSFWQAPGGS
jgi:N-acetyl-S-(2-succino)cysteine monooxygenase